MGRSAHERRPSRARAPTRRDEPRRLAPDRRPELPLSAALDRARRVLLRASLRRHAHRAQHERQRRLEQPHGLAGGLVRRRVRGAALLEHEDQVGVVVERRVARRHRAHLLERVARPLPLGRGPRAERISVSLRSRRGPVAAERDHPDRIQAPLHAGLRGGRALVRLGAQERFHVLGRGACTADIAPTICRRTIRPRSPISSRSASSQ